MSDTTNTNQYNTFDNKSIREDFENAVYIIDKNVTPFLTMAGTTKATAVQHKWQSDRYRDANLNNAHLQGHKYVSNAFTPTTQVANYCQKLYQAAEVTGTMLRSSTAGMDNLMSFEMTKAVKEVKRDAEAILLSNNVAFAGNATAATTTAGFGSWIVTNSSDAGTGSGYAAPVMSSTTPSYPMTAATLNANAGVFTSTLYKDAIAGIMDETGSVEGYTTLLGTYNKTKFSSFTGIVTQQQIVNGHQEADIIAAARYYTSDFGTLKVVTDIFMPKDTVYLLDPRLVSVAYLEPWTVKKDLPTDADSKKNVVESELTLVVKNEAGCAAIRNTTISG